VTGWKRGGLLVSYLKRKRGQLIVACFLVSSLLLAAFPRIDLSISKAFYSGGFHLIARSWQTFLQQGLNYFVLASVVLVVGVYVFNSLYRRHLLRIDGRKVCYLLLVLIIGAGLVVNVLLKDNFGRARPRDVAEFGGQKLFTPAFVVSGECNTNCSFSSGDGAGAFFSLALALALSRRRRFFLAGLGLGVVVSLGRIAAGAHFFSDTVVSFFVMLITADVLYHYMFLSNSARQTSLVRDNAMAPAAAGRNIQQ
jgi:lipid A 4'-phosphatase